MEKRLIRKRRIMGMRINRVPNDEVKSPHVATFWEWILYSLGGGVVDYMVGAEATNQLSPEFPLTGRTDH